jgi:hypothetical protein
MDPIPARLHVVLAREASKAVIVRRGPSNWARIILWHTDTDTFEGGQWLRGRIFGERCALSPDGSLFLYFAMQWHKARGGYRGTWTALSKPPYLTALALWPLGSTYGGGGIFIDNRTILLNYAFSDKPHPDHLPPKQLRVVTSEDQLTQKDQRALERIREEGWQIVHQPADIRDVYAYNRRVKDPPVWHHAHPTNERYTLVQRNYGYLPDYYPSSALIEYALMDWIDNTEIKLEGANWADWDQQGRLAYVRDGQVFAQEPQDVGTFARPLADFNDMTFEEMPPPGWATRW